VDRSEADTPALTAAITALRRAGAAFAYLHGSQVFEDDPVARVRWEATTRTVWFDERPRFERSHREFLAAITDG